MSISFSGVGSGLPVSDWIEQLMSIERRPVDTLYQKKYTIQTSKTTLNTLESKVSSLRSNIEKLTDTNLGASFDLFSKRLAASSNTAIATATASNNSAIQNITLKIEQLATATKAQTLDTNKVADTVTGDELITKLGDNQGTTGKFSIFVDGVKKEFTIDETDTLNDVKDTINNTPGVGVTANIVDGKFQISFDSTKTVVLGSSGDTSNFWNITQLSTASAQDLVPDVSKAFTSDNALSAIDTLGTIADNDVNLNQFVAEDILGTFKIGKATFTIDETTTFNGLINKINNDEDAGVVARYDLKTNKLVLTSKNPGQVAINMMDSSNVDPTDTEPPTSNFLTAMGLIKSDGDAMASQVNTLGSNAKVYLNGSETALYANSNTLTGDITGISGLTVNLLDETEVGKTININVSQDTGQLVTAVNNFLSKFNEIVSEIDATTSKSGNLKSDYSLVRLRNDLRQTATGSVSGLTKYDSFGMIGITSGSVGTSAKVGATALSLDTDKFLEALSENPSDVKALLVGDSSAGITGIMQTLESKVESALDPTNGYFNTKKKSMETSITDIDKSIKRGELRLESVRKRLVNEFSLMDQMISQMKTQGGALSMF